MSSSRIQAYQIARKIDPGFAKWQFDNIRKLTEKKPCWCAHCGVRQNNEGKRKCRCTLHRPRSHRQSTPSDTLHMCCNKKIFSIFLNLNFCDISKHKIFFIIQTNRQCLRLRLSLSASFAILALMASRIFARLTFLAICGFLLGLRQIGQSIVSILPNWKFENKIQKVWEFVFIEW